ncbi:MAG: hypothetical protein NC400_13160 [Clostridium sp.]|nr:hypothetical protein [Clostridium sp.]
MRKNKIVKWCIIACLAFGMVISPASQVKVQAAEVIATVSGTVLSGTTSELLLLSTKEGRMEIKLDSNTDTSACKVLLPDEKISVSVSQGNDEYLHAVKITSGEKKTAATLDASTSATVVGTVKKKDANDVLFVKTPQGDMEIKLDTTTNMNGCSVIVADKTYTITCVRGSDAYMHAVSISDGVAAGVVSSSLTPAPASAVTTDTTSVSGTVSDKTKENMLFFSTQAGEMEIVIDANTDSRNGMFLIPGRKLTVAVYNGGDGYMHAASIMASKEYMYAVDVDTSDTSTVTGTVGKKSTENILYLDTPQGEMELKLDKLSSVSGCKVLVSGKKLSVTCARGADAYMHAVSITAV